MKTMNFIKNEDSKKYIVLKDGYNKGLIIGLLVLMVALTAIGTSKMWLPDDRPILSLNDHYELNLNNDTYVTGAMKADTEKGLAELEINEKFLNYEKKYDPTYTVTDSNGTELPYTLIQEDMEITEDTLTSERKSLLQIGIPEDVYYIKVSVSQKDLETQDMIFDYRNFKKESLTEKGKNYLNEKMKKSKEKESSKKKKSDEQSSEKTKETEDKKDSGTSNSKASDSKEKDSGSKDQEE